MALRTEARCQILTHFLNTGEVLGPHNNYQVINEWESPNRPYKTFEPVGYAKRSVQITERLHLLYKTVHVMQVDRIRLTRDLRRSWMLRAMVHHEILGRPLPSQESWLCQIYGWRTELIALADSVYTLPTHHRVFHFSKKTDWQVFLLGDLAKEIRGALELQLDWRYFFKAEDLVEEYRRLVMKLGVHIKGLLEEWRQDVERMFQNRLSQDIIDMERQKMESSAYNQDVLDKRLRPTDQAMAHERRPFTRRPKSDEIKPGTPQLLNSRIPIPVNHLIGNSNGPRTPHMNARGQSVSERGPASSETLQGRNSLSRATSLSMPQRRTLYPRAAIRPVIPSASPLAQGHDEDQDN